MTYVTDWGTHTLTYDGFRRIVNQYVDTNEHLESKDILQESLDNIYGSFVENTGLTNIQSRRQNFIKYFGIDDRKYNLKDANVFKVHLEIDDAFWKPLDSK